jgi:hypothetical protein
VPKSGNVLELHFDEILHVVDGLNPEAEAGPHYCRQQPWHPFLLEWRVNVQPLRSNAGGDGSYDDAFITKSYRLPSGGVDLVLDGAAGTVPFAGDTNQYAGRAILTDYAKSQLRLQLEAYLEQQLVPLYRKDRGIAGEKPDTPSPVWKDVAAWYSQWREAATKKDEVIESLWAAYCELIEEEEGAHWCITQSLSGFNDALLMRTRTLQLPVDEPLGFDENREFTDRVRAAVGNHNRDAPQPFDDFLPIRAGHLTIDALRLVDTFGRVQELVFRADQSPIVATETMAVPGSAEAVELRPRLTQPARINFRWLPGPIVCGWVVHDRLGESLMIYADDGQALGSVIGRGRWRPAPGRVPAVWPDDIANATLRALVAHVLASDVNVEDLIDRIETNLDAADPEHSSHHHGTAFLIGRPLAVARASVRLELRGLPAVRQDWDAFRRRIQGVTDPAAAYDRFTRVKFPIRIGAHEQMNDGLVALWRDEGRDDDPRRVVRDLMYGSDHPAEILLSPEDAATSLILLLDPRGVVHAMSGILPAKTIAIPHEQYAHAVRRLESTFQTGPVITPRGGIRLPLPSEPGHAWWWVERRDRAWTTVNTIERPRLDARWGESHEIVEGWVRLTNVDTSEDDDATE